MIHIRRGVVRRVTATRQGAQELEVEIGGEVAPAIAYPAMSGDVVPGDAVLLNTTAMDLGLGTGGVHLVIAIEGRDVVTEPALGHVMKARYTPLQTAVGSVEETDAALLEASEGLGQVPVVCAPLHSMLAPDRGGREARRRRTGHLPDDGRRGPAGRVLPARAGAPFGGGPRRLDHVRTGVRRATSRR